jgi:hypothetical protein
MAARYPLRADVIKMKALGERGGRFTEGSR